MAQSLVQQVAAAEIAQAQSQVAYAQEKFNQDRQLVNADALPRRNALESETQLAQANSEIQFRVPCQYLCDRQFSQPAKNCDRIRTLPEIGARQLMLRQWL